ARDPDLLVLDLHVTYWNGPAYRDPYALTAATARQDWYARLDRSREVYTPQAVIDGRTVLVGSRAGPMRAAIAAARPDAAMAVPLRIARAGDTVAVTIGAGPAPPVPARVLLFGYDAAHVTHVGGGENAGAVLAEADVVRALAPIGAWRGAPATFRAPRPEGAHIAVLLQAADGRILGAARK
ncbi:MAG: DUF1223 domain-containing protein, partial [Rhodospirillales bacterium]|nr:DUF1223 domain-containing protein [Rhodospirillales bacterium]